MTVVSTAAGLIVMGFGAGWMAGRLYEDFGVTVIWNKQTAMQGCGLILAGLMIIVFL